MALRFRHQYIDRCTPGWENDVCLLGDVDGDGYADVVIGGKEGQDNLVWYRYPSWTRHTIGTANLEAGGVLLDITGNGQLDLVVGRPSGGKELYWFENQGTWRWPMRVIEDTLCKYHDQAVGDVDADGEPEIVVASQEAGVLVYYDLPPDPWVSPWPPECRHLVCEDLMAEGLVVADLNGDGRQEIVAGPNWFEPPGGAGGRWRRHQFADFRDCRAAVGDLNRDGAPEIVLCEGEADQGRLSWFEGRGWEREHLIADDLFHPHSLALASFGGGDGLDVFVAEMGLGRHDRARVLIYVNRGQGQFEEFPVAEGHPTHEAKVGDMGRTGLPDIVGKPYRPGRYVEWWENVSAPE